MPADAYCDRISMEEYLADRSHLRGGVLSMVESEPEKFGDWLAGKDVDTSTPSTGRGSYWHARLLEPDTITRDFAFFPNRNEAPNKDGDPQDPTPGGRYKTAMKNCNNAKAYLREWGQAHRGRTVVFPEDQPKVEAMVRAVMAHPEASALLEPDGDFAPEMTIRWTCSTTGALLQIRPDFIRPSRLIWGELKSWEPRNGQRLDTTNPSLILDWCRTGGWHRKSAMTHDGCRAISGKNWQGRWIVVEATEHNPRVSVVHDTDEELPCLAMLGRDGDGEEIMGYLDLVREAQRRREDSDFQHACVAHPVHGWNMPEWLVTRMSFNDASKGNDRGGVGFVPPILGAEEYDGT